jgi:hypothetical protein
MEWLRDQYVEYRRRELADQFGFDYDQGCQFQFLYDEDGNLVTDEINFEYQDTEGNRLDVDHVQLRKSFQQVYETIPAPSGFLGPPILPQMHEHMVAYVWQGQIIDPVTGNPGCWCQTDPDESAKVVVPIDPLRKRHDTYFNDIFETVEKATGQDLTRHEVANRYYRDLTNSEPWYTFKVGEVDFIVGPRKRRSPSMPGAKRKPSSI